MSRKAFLSANEAAAHGVRLAKPQVVSAYPITPQTTLVEKIADFIADGESDIDYIMVESEHSAMAAACCSDRRSCIHRLLLAGSAVHG